MTSQGTRTYDALGNLTREVKDGQTTSYTWSTQDFLKQVTAPGGAKEYYSYCGEGIRRKVVSGGLTRLFIRDGDNILLEADAGNNSTLRRYTHRGDGWGELISLRENGSSLYYGFDGSANTRLLTDASAGMSDAYLYSAFGQELLVSGSSDNPLRFGGELGYYRDAAKRLYVRARHLDVIAGRWLSRDPSGFGGGDWNLYGYVGNNSTGRIDPSGLQATPIPQPCPTPPPISSAQRCADAKEAVEVNCKAGSPTKSCDSISNKPYNDLLNTNDHSKICNGISARIYAGEICLMARYYVTEICYDGIQDKKHFDHEDPIHEQVEQCRNEYVRNACGKKPRVRPPLPIPVRGKQPKTAPQQYHGRVLMQGSPGWQRALAWLALAGITAITAIIIADDATLIGVADDGTLIPLGAAASWLIQFLRPAMNTALAR